MRLAVPRCVLSSRIHSLARSARSLFNECQNSLLHTSFPLQWGGAEPDFQIVFGIGTGRSGTNSLWRLLKFQAFSVVTHEDRTIKPEPFWVVPSNLTREAIAKDRIDFYKQVRERHGDVLIGDVWSTHLPYVEAYIALDPTVKVVVLERNREAVVKSFMSKTDYPDVRNHWMEWYEGARCVAPSHVFPNLTTVMT